MAGGIKIVSGGTLCLLLVSLGATMSVFDEVFLDDVEEEMQQGEHFIYEELFPLESKSADPKDLILLKLINSLEILNDDTQLIFPNEPTVMDFNKEFTKSLEFDTKEPMIKMHSDILETIINQNRNCKQ